jgi:hypothetical protein
VYPPDVEIVEPEKPQREAKSNMCTPA